MASPNMQESKEFGAELPLHEIRAADSIFTSVMNYTGKIRAFVEQDYDTEDTETNMEVNAPEIEVNEVRNGVEKSRDAEIDTSSDNTGTGNEMSDTKGNKVHVNENSISPLQDYGTEDTGANVTVISPEAEVDEERNMIEKLHDAEMNVSGDNTDSRVKMPLEDGNERPPNDISMKQDYGIEDTGANLKVDSPEQEDSEERDRVEKLHDDAMNISSDNTDLRDEKSASERNDEGHVSERSTTTKEPFPLFSSLFNTNAESLREHNEKKDEHCELEINQSRNDMPRDLSAPDVTSSIETVMSDTGYENSSKEKTTPVCERRSSTTESNAIQSSTIKSANEENDKLESVSVPHAIVESSETSRLNTTNKELLPHNDIKSPDARDSDDCDTWKPYGTGSTTEESNREKHLENFKTVDSISPDHPALQTLCENIVNNTLNTISTEIFRNDDSNFPVGNQSNEVEEQMPGSFLQLNNASTPFCLAELQSLEDIPNYEPLSEKAFEMQNMYLEGANVKCFTPFESTVEDMDPDTVCGIGSFKPKWLQRWATPTTYLIIFSIIGVLQGSYYTYLLGILSTIEKRYAFKSKISGIIMMVDEITPVLLGVLVGYFGGKSHRPRMVAIGMYLSALCCFVSALPYFMYGTDPRLIASITSNFTRSAHCESNAQAAECDEDDRPPTMVAVVCFVFGSFLKGFGNLAYYAIGLAYMDDTGKKKNMPIYFAISSTLRMLGPALGFFMSSAALKFYEDPTGDPGFGPEDARWVGAWWTGFVLQGSLLFVFSFPMLLFPRRLPHQRQRALSNTQNFDQESLRERVAGLFTAVKRLIRNPIYIWFAVGTIFAIIGGFGYFIMLPKYVEIQFRLTASESSLLSGPPSLVAVQVSTLIGGLIVWKWKPSARVLIGGILGTEAITIICYMVLMMYSCGNYDMPGTSLTNGELKLQNECNAGCNCTTGVFMPVCGPDGMSTYFSPCHAACANSGVVDGTQRFYNCSCVHDEEGEISFSESVTNGYCYDASCWMKAVGFVATLVCFSLFANSMRAGHTVLLLRSVEPRDKSVALGMFETFICAFAFIPYPVIYGSLVDSACLVWESSCGITGNCWIYDVDLFKYLLHGVAATFACASVLCYAVVFCLAGRVRDLYKEEDTISLEEPSGPCVPEI